MICARPAKTINEETTAMPTHPVSRDPRAGVFAVAARWLVAAACLLVAVGVAAATAASAEAAGDVEITAFSAGLTNYQAGGHPDAFASFRFATEPATGPMGQPGFGCPTADGHCEVIRGGAPKDIVVELPKGIFGNPREIPQCTLSELTGENCPVAAQVGIQVLHLVWIGAPDDGEFIPLEGLKVPLYNMVPDRGEVAKLGMRVKGAVNTFISVTVRSDGDYGLTTSVENIFTGLPVWGADVQIWGDPYNSAHDPDRYCFNNEFGCSAERSSVPFMVAPAECGVEAVTTLAVRSWLKPGEDGWSTADSSPEQVTGCEKLTFTPSASMQPTSTAPDSPTGLDVDLTFPHQFNNVNGLESPPLKDAKVVLPEGMTINPASADGLEACSDEQLKLKSKAPVTCPFGSKIGTVEAETPVLDERLTGGVYVRSQNSDDPASGEMFRIAIVLENAERGLSIRLPGQVRVNPDTGRIETTFANNPQLPVSKISLKLKGGPRAPLATPAACGTKTVDTQLDAWSGQQANLHDSFTIDCPGSGGFAPAFDAGTVSPTGGSFSPFVVRIDRSDRQQYLSGVSVDMPKGLIAKLRGVPLCGSFQAENGGCPAGSRIGTATVSAGAGSNPYTVKGDLYLTNGYKGGPYGLSAQVHAKAGPFDLGWVRVRQAIYVDPVTAELSVVSDPLPQIVKGVPVRLRSVNVDVDKPNFTINPTSCSEKQVNAKLSSIDGAIRNTSSRFQAGDCQALAFKPRLAMRLSGKSQRRTGGHPGLRTVLTQKAGQANIGRAEVALPRSIALDANNSYDPKLVCDYDRALKADCPVSSVIGKANARTPVLNRSLTGNVHLVQGIKFGPKGNRIRTLPTLLVKLRGEVAIDLRAKTSTSTDDRLVTTFPEVPDAPVSKFTLNINGGNKGILVVTKTAKAKINICNSKQIATVETDGQNGKQADYNTQVKTPCASKAGKSKKAKRGRASR